jgi:hypothetical protein
VKRIIDKRSRKRLAAAAILLQALSASSVYADPIRSDHPLIGTWRLNLPALSCREIYVVRADATQLVKSAEEVTESAFSISDQPSEKGFYKWTDKITKSNGKKDCLGRTIPVDDESSSYIIFNPSQTQFLMCEAEDMNTCFGPFIRLQGEGI